MGPWTADVYLLFRLGQGDAWPAGDLALQESVHIGLGLDTRPSAKQMGPLAENWHPLRGAAAHLWWAYYKAQRKNAKARRFGQYKNDAKDLTRICANASWFMVAVLSGDVGDRRYTVDLDVKRSGQRTTFGKQIKVTNLSNGRSVTVTIVDRGPFGRIIDLSARAASIIGSADLMRVELTSE